MSAPETSYWQEIAEQRQQRIGLLKTALRYIEWVWDEGLSDNVCPSCGKTEPAGHDWSCKTAKALGE